MLRVVFPATAQRPRWRHRPGVLPASQLALAHNRWPCASLPRPIVACRRRRGWCRTVRR
jgi:hypothetical protein